MKPGARAREILQGAGGTGDVDNVNPDRRKRLQLCSSQADVGCLTTTAFLPVMSRGSWWHHLTSWLGLASLGEM